MQPHRLLLSHDFNAEYADINRIAAWVKRTVMPYTRSATSSAVYAAPFIVHQQDLYSCVRLAPLAQHACRGSIWTSC